MSFGLDYVTGPPIADMKSAGVAFVCRYVGYFSGYNPNEVATPQGKVLTPGEAKANMTAGIASVSNWEWYANRAVDGATAQIRFANGVWDANIANKIHLACGGPVTRPIYFSVDVDVDGSAVSDYFKGVASVIGVARTGAYGSFRVLQYLFNARAIAWGWQTYAWSAGAWEPRAHIQQYQNGVMLSGHSVDYNRSIKSDFGQWFPLKGGTPMATIDLTLPTIAAYFQLANGNQWLSLHTRTNTGGPIYLHGDMLRYYMTNGCQPYCGFSDAGLVLSNEVPIAQFSSLFADNPTLMQELIAEGCVIVYFQRAVWCYDPKHLLPGEVPTGAGTVYPLQLYGGGPGTDPYIAQLKADIAQMGQQIQTAAQQITNLEQQVQALEQGNTQVQSLESRLSQIAPLATQINALAAQGN